MNPRTLGCAVILSLLLPVACRDEEPAPDVDQIVSDACAVYQACESNTPYATVEECAAKMEMLLEKADEECYDARLRYHECEGMLTCVEYVALQGLDPDAKCSDEYEAYFLECEV
jgi:hypothetical protein